MMCRNVKCFSSIMKSESSSDDGKDVSFHFAKVNRSNFVHLRNSGRASFTGVLPTQMSFFQVFVMFQFSQIWWSNETRIHPKYLHLSAVPKNLRGGEQRFLSLKSDTCYLIRMNSLVSPNVKILQLLKTNNFVMQIVWSFI